MSSLREGSRASYLKTDRQFVRDLFSVGLGIAAYPKLAFSVPPKKDNSNEIEISVA